MRHIFKWIPEEQGELSPDQEDFYAEFHAARSDLRITLP